MAPGLLLHDDSHNENLSSTQPVVNANAGIVPSKTSSLIPKSWDSGLFESELVANSVTPRPFDKNNLIAPAKQPLPVARGSFAGTQKAVTEIYKRAEESFASYFDVADVETFIPRPVALEEKRQIYTYQSPWSDNFPPHLHLIPLKDQAALTTIFNKQRLFDTGTLLTQLVPDYVFDFLHSNPESDTLAGLGKRNKELRALKKDIFTDPNIGDRDDWYTDRIFAQQQFTGTNPMTVQSVSDNLLTEFKATAQRQSNDEVYKLLSETDKSNLYVQDYSYFREAVKAQPDAPLQSAEDTDWFRRMQAFFFEDYRNDDKIRYLCASVCLFILDPKSGQLHPLGIVIDYKGSMDKSVVVFNRHLSPSPDKEYSDESTDWPWRYAKTCVQVSDWTRHEITVHLTNTHFVEEATIVAAQRSFEDSHPVLALLKPHWIRTLSLNAAARSVLVPSVISKIAGMEDGQLHGFIQHAYNTFDWTANFVPNDLARRGFPIDEIKAAGPDHPRFAKYTYARNMLEMWECLRNFVASMLSADYASDADVAADASLQTWAKEMHANYGGNMASFPASFSTLDEVVDSVTMCIHLASPQHTAVNYLQEYYQSFVVNKPPCLCTPPPSTLEELLAYKEPDLMRALPVNAPRTWLLASHLPHLLSYKVAQDQNLVTYASSLWVLTQQKIDGPEETTEHQIKTEKAAKYLWDELKRLEEVFKQRSEELKEHDDIAYDVMDPVTTAVSILI
ncbi:hypothetical protein MBLNU457_1299t1 [Dothideomycetes sp. NU457]